MADWWPSSIAGDFLSVTHSPPRSIAGSTYAFSYAGSVAGESVYAEELQSSADEEERAASPAMTPSHGGSPRGSLRGSPRGSHGGSIADQSAASSRSASPA